jgi:hypothetical protein
MKIAVVTQLAVWAYSAEQGSVFATRPEAAIRSLKLKI